MESMGNNSLQSKTTFMKIWGIQKKYSELSWFENFMGGNISLGPITIFGANAMCWSVSIKTKWGYLCFTLPVMARWRINSRGKMWWQWYIYISPNATPWACTFYRGSDKNERIRAQIRKLNFGHGFNSKKLKNELYALNQKFHQFKITEHDIECLVDNVD